MNVHGIRCWVATAALMLTLPLAGFAEDAEEGASPSPGSGASGVPSPMLHGKLELSLDDAIRMGLENNLDVQVSRYAPLIAGHEEDIAWGAYDPTSFADLTWNDISTPNANVLFGTPRLNNTDLGGSAGLRGLVPMLNTEFNVQFDGNRKTTNSVVSALSPEFTTGLGVSVTQPLLKDLIWNQPWTQVKTTRVLFESSEADFRRAVMDVVQAIENAYWTLIEFDENDRVARKSLETAQALLEQAETQYEVGVSSKVEVTEAEAGVTRRQFGLIQAENNYRNQQDVLIDLVLGPHLRATSTMEMIPTDRPEEYIVYQIDVEQAVERAFENRPELVTAQREVDRNEINVAFSKNQRMPELDAVVSFGPNGLSGSQNPAACSGPFVPPDQQLACLAGAQIPPTNFGQSAGDWWTKNGGSTFVAGGRFSLPLPNTAARGNVSKSELQLRRSETQKRRLEQNIILQVRQSARNLQAAQEGITSAESARKAAQEQLRAEKIRLEYGESTPFDVLLREEQYVQSEQARIQAYRVYRVSATDLDRSQGTILRNRNIKIDDVRSLR